MALPFRILFAMSTLGPAVTGLTAADEAVPSDEAAFNEAIAMAPFVVEGEDLSIAVHARTQGDRRYAEKFADEVVRVAYETLEDSTGRGLIIIGDQGEPHPLYVYRKFIAMAGAGQLDPAVAELADGLTAWLKEWAETMDMDEAEADSSISFDQVVNALPLPLHGPGSKLYQWAWLEHFDVEQVELKFHALRLADFENDQLARYDWVFYLPPKSAFDQVLRDILPTALKESDLGFFQRTMVRGAVVAFKPVIRKAVEGMRKGMLLLTVLDARSDWSQDDIKAITGAYMETLMPDMKFNDGRNATHARAMEAIERQKERNAAYAADPFVSPKRLTTFDAAAYATLAGDFQDRDAKEVTHRFRATPDGGFTWQYRDRDPGPFFPAGERLLVNERGTMTIEFLADDTGNVTGVEERWHRRRKTVPRAE